MSFAPFLWVIVFQAQYAKSIYIKHISQCIQFITIIYIITHVIENSIPFGNLFHYCQKVCTAGKHIRLKKRLLPSHRTIAFSHFIFISICLSFLASQSQCIILLNLTAFIYLPNAFGRFHTSPYHPTLTEGNSSLYSLKTQYDILHFRP